MFVLTNATLKMRGLAFFLLLSVKMFSQPIDCCPDSPTAITGNYAVQVGCSAIITGGYSASGSTSVEHTGFDLCSDSACLNYQRFETSSIRTVFNLAVSMPSPFKFYRAFAKNATDIGFGEIKALKPKDYNGNHYDEVTIGTQVWLVQNLASTFYQNGDSITEAWSNTAWLSPAPCDNVRVGNPPNLGQYVEVDGDYQGSPAVNPINFDLSLLLNSALHGLLYNWWVAWDSRNPCPCGYRVPTEQDFQALTNFVGGNSGALKAINHWSAPNTGATNSTGFSIIPTGSRLQWNLDLSTFCYTTTMLNGLGTSAAFWTSTEGLDNRNGFTWGVNHNSTTIFFSQSRKIGGRAIRCIKD